MRWFAGLLLALASAGAQAQTYRLAHDQLFPPFAEAKGGVSSGIAVDLLKAAAEKAGITVVFVGVPFDQFGATLGDGRADAIFPLAINPERRQQYDFTAPIMVTGGSLYVRAPASTPTLGELAGKSVATPRTGPLAGFIQRTAPEVRLETVTDYETALQALVDGKYDAVALNATVGGVLAEKLHPGRVTPAARMFLELPLAIAVPKGARADLVAAFDRGIAAIRADGTWERINRTAAGR